MIHHLKYNLGYGSLSQTELSYASPHQTQSASAQHQGYSGPAQLVSRLVPLSEKYKFDGSGIRPEFCNIPNEGLTIIVPQGRRDSVSVNMNEQRYIHQSRIQGQSAETMYKELHDMRMRERPRTTPRSQVEPETFELLDDCIKEGIRNHPVQERRHWDKTRRPYAQGEQPVALLERNPQPDQDHGQQKERTYFLLYDEAMGSYTREISGTFLISKPMLLMNQFQCSSTVHMDCGFSVK